MGIGVRGSNIWKMWNIYIFDVFRTCFAYLDFSLIKYGSGEVRSYSEAETDPSARTGSLKHPKNVEIKVSDFEILPMGSGKRSGRSRRGGWESPRI